MFRGKFIAFKAFTEKGSFQSNDLKRLEKEEQIESKISRGKEIIKSRTQKQNKTKRLTGKQKGKINESKY